VLARPRPLAPGLVILLPDRLEPGEGGRRQVGGSGPRSAWRASVRRSWPWGRGPRRISVVDLWQGGVLLGLVGPLVCL
jgi:hypothetical protein